MSDYLSIYMYHIRSPYSANRPPYISLEILLLVRPNRGHGRVYRVKG